MNKNDSLNHFENMAKIKEWDNTAKYILVYVQLDGRAHNMLKQLPEDKKFMLVKIS